MVYIPPSRASFAAELGSIAGIDNIEPVFKNAKPSNIPGVRDPSGWQRIELSAPASRIKSIVRALKSFEGVTEAEPVYERKLSITGPLVSELDDPKMGDQWHLDAAKIRRRGRSLRVDGLPAGGDESIVVAVIDTGVDYDHPDLAANMWVNTQEIPGNNVDDDNNGFVDDIMGSALSVRATATLEILMMITGTGLTWLGLLHRQGPMELGVLALRTIVRLWL